jgi:peptidoglycan/xylan/chitin deacetylase (PgdA/CDA1 family)
MMTPILMYHEVGEPGMFPEGAVPSWTVAPHQFRDHLAMLADEGYMGLSVPRWLAMRGTPPPGWKPVVITFDDGYRGNVENAIPALLDRGWSATFFVVSGRMTWDAYARAADWSAAAGAGMDVESHTLTHPFLGALPLEEVLRELVESRSALEAVAGCPVRGLSWPNGDAPRGGLALLSGCGYDWAATSRPAFGMAGSDARSLPRLAVRAWHDAAGLERLVDRGMAHRLRMDVMYRAKRLGRGILGRKRYADLQRRMME